MNTINNYLQESIRWDYAGAVVKASSSDIKAIENKFKVKLPNEYKSIVSKHDGAYPATHQCINTRSSGASEFCIDHMLSLKIRNGVSDIIKTHESFDEGSNKRGSWVARWNKLTFCKRW